MGDSTSGDDNQRPDDTCAQCSEELKLAAEDGAQDSAAGRLGDAGDVYGSNAFAAEIHQWTHEIHCAAHQSGNQRGSEAYPDSICSHQNVPGEKGTQKGNCHFSQDGCRTRKSHMLYLCEGRLYVDLCEEDNQYYEGNAECRYKKEAFH
jgi:hypothetical protein